MKLAAQKIIQVKFCTEFWTLLKNGVFTFWFNMRAFTASNGSANIVVVTPVTNPAKTNRE